MCLLPLLLLALPHPDLGTEVVAYEQQPEPSSLPLSQPLLSSLWQGPQPTTRPVVLQQNEETFGEEDSL